MFGPHHDVEQVRRLVENGSISSCIRAAIPVNHSREQTQASETLQLATADSRAIFAVPSRNEHYPQPAIMLLPRNNPTD
jgi:hypothetical protein